MFLFALNIYIFKFPFGKFKGLKKTNTNPHRFILVYIFLKAIRPCNLFAESRPDRKNIYNSLYSFFSTTKIVEILGKIKHFLSFIGLFILLFFCHRSHFIFVRPVFYNFGYQCCRNPVFNRKLNGSFRGFVAC